VQIHGGMGFIEETGAAQHLRDARILPIYEGTNGIQARDLVGRKVTKDGGETMLGLVAEMRALVPELKKAQGDDLAAIAAGVAAAADALEDAARWMAQAAKADLVNALAGSVPSCGWPARRWRLLLARSALVAQGKLATRDGDPAFLEAKVITARFFAEVILPPALAQLGPLKAAAARCSLSRRSSSEPGSDRTADDEARAFADSFDLAHLDRLSSTIRSRATTRCAASRH